MNKRAKVSKAWRERNRRNGVCVGCTRKAPKGFALCKRCRQTRAEFQANRIAKGLCFRCSNAAAPGRKKCLDCVVKNALYDLRRKGLPKDEIEAASIAWSRYKGFCACCGDPIPPGKERFDHDHDGLFFRGIICHGCNVSIGFAQDSPDRLEKIANYVRGRS